MKLLLLIIVIPAVSIFLIIRILEHISVFYPSNEVLYTPQNLDLEFEDVYLIDAEDNIHIHGWWIPAEVDGKTVLFLHGNAGNIGDRLDKISMLNNVGVNLLIIDYRGFGRSEGKPSEEGMYKDAQLAMDYLVDERMIDPADIIVYGDSIGGVAAIDAASNNEVGGLVVDSSFTHSRDMAKRIYSWVPSFLVRLRLNSLEKIKHVRAPKLFYHSPNDQTVPYSLGRKLYEAASTPKTFVDTEGGHNDAHVHSEELYTKTFRNFLNTLERVK